MTYQDGGRFETFISRPAFMTPRLLSGSALSVQEKAESVQNLSASIIWGSGARVFGDVLPEVNWRETHDA
jgi:hypothetical protein